MSLPRLTALLSPLSIPCGCSSSANRGRSIHAHVRPSAKCRPQPAGLGLPMREPSVVSCVPLAPRITCSLLTVIATKHFFDFGNREWLVATRERPVDYRPSQNDGVYATVK